MSDSAPRRRRRQRDVVLALLSTLALLGFASTRTMASWTRSASVSPGSARAGTLDVVAGGQLVGQANVDGTFEELSWQMDDLLPGEHLAVSFTAANGGSGNIPLDLRLDAYVTGTLGPAISFRFHEGGTPINTTPLTNVGWDTYRDATCDGGTQIGPTWQNLGTSAATATPIVTTKQRLQVGQSKSYCVMLAVAGTPTVWDNTVYLATSATVYFVLRGTQVGAP